VPDSRTPWMTVERDAMNSMAPGFHAVKRRVAALIKTAAARRKEGLIRPCLQGCFGKIFEVWVFVIRLIFLCWVLAPTILLIFF
jgi:hypothetical protein